MGTLDDAIREHLELKKRSGASQEEVQRLEHEAFGPGRRDAPVPAAEPVVDPDPVEPVEPVEPVAEAPPAPEPLEPHSAPSPEPATRGRDDAWLEDDPDEVPFGEALDHRRGAAPQPTSEFTAEEVVDAGGKPPSDYVAPDDEGEDLLEETPEFLQETPEHDRLWFEQRPPRDFDFDE